MGVKYLILAIICVMIAFSFIPLGGDRIGFPFSETLLHPSWYVFVIGSHTAYVMFSIALYWVSRDSFFKVLLFAMTCKLIGFTLNANEDYFYFIDINYFIMFILCMKIVWDEIRGFN